MDALWPESNRGSRHISVRAAAVSKRKKGKYPSWWTTKSSLGLLAGFGLAYFALVPLEAHPLHWLFSILGGALGYGIGLLLDAGLPSVARFVRRGSRSMTVKQPRVKKVNKETK